MNNKFWWVEYTMGNSAYTFYLSGILRNRAAILDTYNGTTQWVSLDDITVVDTDLWASGD